MLRFLINWNLKIFKIPVGPHNLIKEKVNDLVDVQFLMWAHII